MDIETLKALLNEVYAAYGQAGCVCRFPRFRKLTFFDFCDYGIGPTACLESELLIDLALRGEQTAYATAAEPGKAPNSPWTYQCRLCRASIGERYEEYNIHMSRSYLAFPSLPLPDLGAPADLPIPVVNGLYGFNRREWSALDGVFKRSTPEAFVAYMTATADQMSA